VIRRGIWVSSNTEGIKGEVRGGWIRSID